MIVQENGVGAGFPTPQVGRTAGQIRVFDVSKLYTGGFNQAAGAQSAVSELSASAEASVANRAADSARSGAASLFGKVWSKGADFAEKQVDSGVNRAGDYVGKLVGAGSPSSGGGVGALEAAAGVEEGGSYMPAATSALKLSAPVAVVALAAAAFFLLRKRR